jgi:uncharacterized membrane protein YtjA (UPF0391 family)
VSVLPSQSASLSAVALCGIRQIDRWPGEVCSHPVGIFCAPRPLAAQTEADAAVASNLQARSVEVVMLYWALTFFVVALIAAIMGFTGVAIAAAGIAKILFFVFLVLFLVSLIAHMSRRI